MGESQVYSEHDGFGVSTSRDGLHWSEGVDVVLPGGCRTPLGVIDEGAAVIMTRSSRASIEYIVLLFIHNPSTLRPYLGISYMYKIIYLSYM